MNVNRRVPAKSRTTNGCHHQAHAYGAPWGLLALPAGAPPSDGEAGFPFILWWAEDAGGSSLGIDWTGCGHHKKRWSRKEG